MDAVCMQSRHWLLMTLFSLAVAVSGCRPAESPAPPPAAPSPAAPAASESAMPPAEQQASEEAALFPREDGTRQAEAPRTREQFRSPLVEHADRLTPLDPKAPIWIDLESKTVVLVAAVCQRKGPLELFACLEATKEYESVLSLPVLGKAIHAALIRVGADPGHPVQFQEKYVPASGPEIEITLFWKDEQGKTQTARAQDWVRNVQTHEAMTYPWVFGGSQLVQDEETHKPVYLADASGDLICVSNFPDAMFDVPVESTDSDAALVFEAFTEHIPARGTPVTLVLTPKK